MVHLSLSKRVRLLISRTPIAIAILQLRTFIGIMPFVVALEAGDVTQVPLHWCNRIGTLLISISSIAIPLVTMVVSIASMLRMTSMIMMVVPSILIGSCSTIS